MKSILFATGILLASTAAQAEIICTNRGCWETGMRIYNHGDAYSGLPYTNHRDDGRPKKRVRIIRESDISNHDRQSTTLSFRLKTPALMPGFSSAKVDQGTMQAKKPTVEQTRQDPENSAEENQQESSGKWPLPGELCGRYAQPLRVIALNVDEGWSQDVSEAMAHKVREIAEHEDYELTQGTLDFIDAHIGRVRQPTLPLW